MTLIWYVIAFPIYFDISFKFEVKRKKKKSLFNTYERKKRQRKKVWYVCVHRESNLCQRIQSPTFKSLCCRDALNNAGTNWSCILNVTQKIKKSRAKTSSRCLSTRVTSPPWYGERAEPRLVSVCGWLIVRVGVVLRRTVAGCNPGESMFVFGWSSGLV